MHIAIKWNPVSLIPKRLLSTICGPDRAFWELMWEQWKCKALTGHMSARHLQLQSIELNDNVSDEEKEGIKFDWVWEKEGPALTMPELAGLIRHLEDAWRSWKYRPFIQEQEVRTSAVQIWELVVHKLPGWSTEKECALGAHREGKYDRIGGSSTFKV